MTSSSNKFGFDEITGLSRQLLKQGISVKLRAGGFSMFPYLRRKDLLEVKPVPAEQIRPGDVIVFFRTNRFIAHRVHKVSYHDDSDYDFVTTGDSSVNRDEPVNSNNYLGKVVARVRRGRARKLSSPFAVRYGLFVVRCFPYVNMCAALLLRINLILRSVIRKVLKILGRR